MNIIEKLVRAAWEAEKQEHFAREALNAAVREHRGKMSREEEAPITDPLLTALCEASEATERAYKAAVDAWIAFKQLPPPVDRAQFVNYLCDAEDFVTGKKPRGSA